MSPTRPHHIAAASVVAALLAIPVAAPVAAAVPANDDRDDPTAAATLPFVDELDTREATPQRVDEACGGGATVWYTFTPSRSGPYIASTWGSPYDTTLWVGTADGRTAIGCDDDAGGLWSKVHWQGRAGVEYLIMVGSCCDATAPGGDLSFRIRRAPRPPSFDLSVARRARLTRGGGFIVRGRTSDCVRARQLGLSVLGRQDHGRRIVRGAGHLSPSCGERFTVRVRDRSFRFAVGRARVRVRATTCNSVTCTTRSRKGTVRLRSR